MVVFVNAAGVSLEKFAMGVFKTINRYESTPRSANAPANLADYKGRYDTMARGNETLMAPWKGKLLVYVVPSNESVSAKPRLLVSTSTPDLFRTDRKEDLPGIPLRFERDASGRIARYWQNNNVRE